MMSSNFLSDKHFSISSAAEVKEICQPLFDQYQIDGFIYVKMYNNGSLVLMTSIPLYPNLHFTSGYKAHIQLPIPVEFLRRKSFYFLPGMTADSNYQEFLSMTRTHLNQDYPLYMIDSYADCVELFVFVSKATQVNALNTYLNNIEVLEKFKYYFKNKALQLREKGEKNRILLPENFRLNLKSSSHDAILAEVKTSFDKDLSLHHYELRDLNATLSKREMDCLYYLGKGFTIKGIGRELNLSPRTVEAYLNSIKDKTGCYSKNDLIKLLSKMSP